MDPMLCVCDLDATVRAQPMFSALEHLLLVLDTDMAWQSSPPRMYWASGLLADEQAQHQQLSIRASNDAHEGQPT
jgi:hypothetical protein